MSEDLQIRCEMFKSDLIGAVASYSDKSGSLYPLLDILMLFYQEPLIISFFDYKKDLVFCTMKDWEYCDYADAMVVKGIDNGLIALSDTEYYIRFHSYAISSDGLLIKPLSQEKQERFKVIFQLLESDTSMGYYVFTAFATQLMVFNQNKQSSSPAKCEVDQCEIDATEVQELLVPMRSVIDEAVNLYKDSPLISRINGEQILCHNLFTVVQSKTIGSDLKRKNCFDYTARILLSNTQRENISKDIKDIKDMSCEDIELPLSRNARSIADSVFASGIIDFSAETPGSGRDDHGDSASDLRRHQAEARVYGRLIKDPKVFYAPVHISGVPWLLLFTLIPSDAFKAWQQNYHFYTNLLPKIADRLRVSTKNAYLDLIGKIFTKVSSNLDDPSLLSSVNAALRKLTMVYPFNGVRLLDDEGESEGIIYLPNKKGVHVEIYDNPYFVSQVKFDSLSLQDCQKVIAKELLHIQGLFSAERNMKEAEKSAGAPVIIGNSKKHNELIKEAKICAENDSKVLILGESGVGKSLYARYIHYKSKRFDEIFVKRNVGAIVPTLVESELFGSERGAFTGAIQQKKGIIENANNGTLFLDEIGELDLSLQVKLLHVLEGDPIQRVGGTKNIKVNVRFIFATKQNLQEMIKQGRFREDLFYRINVATLIIPPLREHAEDIPGLVKHLIKRSPYTEKITTVKDEAMELLQSYSWPGNIRELENVIERAMMKAKGATITEEHIDIGPHALISSRTNGDKFSSDCLIPLSSKYAKAISKLNEIEKYFEEIGLDAEKVGEKLSPLAKGRKDTALHNVFDRKDVLALFNDSRLSEAEAIERWHHIIKFISSTLKEKKKSYPSYVQNYYSKC